jgi:ATP phosphoribosyltransferase regulatory subunit HisZ
VPFQSQLSTNTGRMNQSAYSLNTAKNAQQLRRFDQFDQSSTNKIQTPTNKFDLNSLNIAQKRPPNPSADGQSAKSRKVVLTPLNKLNLNSQERKHTLDPLTIQTPSNHYSYRNTLQAAQNGDGQAGEGTMFSQAKFIKVP